MITISWPHRHTSSSEWFSLCHITNCGVCQSQKHPIHIHMKDNTLFRFFFFKPPHAPIGSCSLMGIQMPEHTVCWKDIEFLWGTNALWNLILTEFVILLTLAQGKWFEENFIAHMCNLAWDASIQYRFGADGVLSPLSMCQYCHWVNSSALPQWNCWTGSGMSCSWNYLCCTLFTAPWKPSPPPVEKSSLPV